MQPKTLISIFFLCLTLLTCRKTLPSKTKVYSNEGLEILNGNIKELCTTYSSSAQGFDKFTFDRAGFMKTQIVREASIGTIENKADTTIYNWKTNFIYQYKRDKLVTITTEKPGSSKWIFDESGRLIKYIGNIEFENHDIGTGKYNEAGNLIEWIRIESPLKIDPVVHQFKYDNQNRLIESGLFEPAEQPLIKTTYQYILLDSNKNWVKAIVHINRIFPLSAKDSRIDTITRKITYY